MVTEYVSNELLANEQLAGSFSMELTRTELYFGNCLEQMRLLPDRSVDMILADLPNGVTDNPWDSMIDIPSLWYQFNLICTGAITLHA